MLAGDVGDPEQMADLLRVYREGHWKGPEAKVGLVTEIAERYHAAGRFDLLRAFLCDIAESSGDDPYAAYYLWLLAESYRERGVNDLELFYLSRLVQNYDDIEYRSASIHEAALLRIAALAEEPERRVDAYKRLIMEYPREESLPTYYYLLGKDYEKLGEWGQAIQVYTRLKDIARKNAKLAIPNHPEAIDYCKRVVNFYQSEKNWLSPDLVSLVDKVRDALATRNLTALSRLSAKVNFFARAWGDEQENDADQIDTRFTSFYPLDSTIKVSNSLESFSNANEAYLKTTGWLPRTLSTWYFYFRKIYFPADPEIHGQWEWAGVFFGEKQ
jgi:tetratricopeptide (TPR) repeat protein